jgi:antimicrobial peptide system SdpA family protein
MSDQEDASLGSLAVVLGGIGALLVGLTVHGSMPINAISSDLDRELQTTAWAPQSWKFFTRDPQEEQMVLWGLHDGEWRPYSPPGGSPRYAFGLDRAGRAENVEVGILLEGTPMSLFKRCGEDVTPEDCLAKQPKALPLKNEMPRPSVCGSVAVVAQKPVPWAWARTGRKTIMPARVLRLDVECS